MKQTIIRLLSNGVVASRKYTADDLIKAFYPLQYLIKQEGRLIMCNRNNFWNVENNDNRAQLIHKLHRARLHDMHTDYFLIINRFENGDAYGIEKLVDVCPGITLRIE